MAQAPCGGWGSPAPHLLELPLHQWLQSKGVHRPDGHERLIGVVPSLAKPGATHTQGGPPLTRARTSNGPLTPGAARTTHTHAHTGEGCALARGRWQPHAGRAVAAARTTSNACLPPEPAPLVNFIWIHPMDTMMGNMPATTRASCQQAANATAGQRQQTTTTPAHTVHTLHTFTQARTTRACTGPGHVPCSPTGTSLSVTVRPGALSQRAKGG